MPVETSSKSFLTELLQHTEPFFHHERERVLIERQGNHVEVRAFGHDGGMLFRAISREPLNDFSSVACLGNLSYLRSILDADSIRDNGRLEFLYDKASNGGTALRKINAYGRRVEYSYQAKDPSNAGEQRRGANIENSIDFVLQSDVIRDFEEMNRVLFAGDDRARAFTLTYSGGIAKGFFGEGRGVGSTLVFSNDVSGKDTGRNINLLVPAERFRAIMKVCSANVTRLRIVESGIAFEKPTQLALYSYAIAAKTPNT